MPSTSSTGAGTATTSPSLDDLEAADADVVVVVNPDNPTGRLLPPQALRGVAARLLIVDEAFIDLLPHEASLAGDLPDNAIVLRSFGKTYGLAGLRLGFAIAAVPLAQRLREELGPWAVSGPALAIGATALADDAWLRGSGSPPRRRWPQARRTAGLGRIHDPGRHAACSGWRAIPRRTRRSKTSRDRESMSAPSAISRHGCASACRAAMRNSAACQRRFRCRRRCDRRTGRKAPARHSRRIRRAPRRAGPAPSGIPRTGRNRRARSPRPAPPRRDDCAGCRRD